MQLQYVYGESHTNYSLATSMVWPGDYRLAISITVFLFLFFFCIIFASFNGSILGELGQTRANIWKVTLGSKALRTTQNIFFRFSLNGQTRSSSGSFYINKTLWEFSFRFDSPMETTTSIGFVPMIELFLIGWGAKTSIKKK